MTDFDLVVWEIDTSGGLTLETAESAALGLASVMRRCPKARVQFALPGFDTDPRELVDIPEARRFLRQMGEALALYSEKPGQLITRLDYSNVLILAVCMGLVPRVSYVVEPAA